MSHRAIPFVVLTSPRTGSTLLVDMLNSHPQIVAGGELFNVDLVRENRIEWPDARVRDDDDLHRLRREDPVAFVNRIHEIGSQTGASAVGFKLIYEQALETTHSSLIEYLIAETAIRVIHLRRRNVLRQILSVKRAAASGEWHRRVGDDGSSRSRPQAVEIELDECAWFLRRIFNRRRRFDEAFGRHPMLRVDYEDLAADPQAAVRGAQEFLSVSPQDLEVSYGRTGTDDLRGTIANYDDLKAAFTEWSSYFED